MIKHLLVTFFGFMVLLGGAQSDTLKTSLPRSFSFAGQIPEFPGGSGALMDFINSKLQYPQMEKDNHIQGRVVVKFFVGEDGSVNDATVVEKVSYGLDREAIRVVKMLPPFIPGKDKGKPVPVYMTLPVTFTLPQK